MPKNLAFLNLKISIVDRFNNEKKIDYGLYQKPGNNYIPIHPHCPVTEATKFGWITGENIRRLRLSQSNHVFRRYMKIF